MGRGAVSICKDPPPGFREAVDDGVSDDEGMQPSWGNAMIRVCPRVEVELVVGVMG